MSQKQLGTVMGAIIVVLLVAVVYLVWQKQTTTNLQGQQNTGPTGELEEEPSASSTVPLQNQRSSPPPADSTADWQAYTNQDLGFSLKYPSSYRLDVELNDEYNQLAVFRGKNGELFEVRLRGDIGASYGQDEGFLGAEITSRDVKLGGVKAFQSVSTTGYGDAGVQGDPYVAIEAARGAIWYHLVFYGDAKLDATESAIASSFRFVN